MTTATKIERKVKDWEVSFDGEISSGLDFQQVINGMMNGGANAMVRHPRETGGYWVSVESVVTPKVVEQATMEQSKPYNPVAVNFRTIEDTCVVCPYCGGRKVTQESRISTVGIILVVVGVLTIFGFLVAIMGLFCREKYFACWTCRGQF